MKIALISSYVPDERQSMLRYPTMLRNALQARGHEVRILHPPAVLGRLRCLRGEGAKWLGYIDKFLLAPWYLRREVQNSDIVHICDHSNPMMVWSAGKKPQVITCHDLISVRSAKGHYPQVKVRATGRVQQSWLASSLKRAKYVICVSGQTEAEFRSLFPAGQRKLRMIPHALNRCCEPSRPADIEREVKKLGLAPGAPYLLHVGGNDWYKNRPGAMRIFAELRKHPLFREMRLVMVGKPWSREMRDFADSSTAGKWMIEATDVQDDALNGLYGGAQALLFPSLTEGFGWPILEAQACGCPVITTGRAPMTEVGGEAAIYIDPSDPEAAARTILEQWPRRAALREAGLRNAAKFTEDRMAASYLKVYEEILAAELQGSGPSARVRTQE